jgi:hypothetical protein
MEISGLEDEFNLSGALPRLLYVKAPVPQAPEPWPECSGKNPFECPAETGGGSLRDSLPAFWLLTAPEECMYRRW